MKRFIFRALVSFVVLFVASPALARDNVDYWYIKNFDSEIRVNTDSSLDITEWITADCGSAQKHGIYRVLPTTKTLSDSKVIEMPVSLISITDFNDKPISYSASKDWANNTVTWKIGDADVYVSGENYYKIKYKVKNAVLHNSNDFDELYWNLNGNFWDIPTDKFKADVIFPGEIKASNSKINIYSGQFGETNSLGSTASFVEDGRIELTESKTMEPGVGITLSVTFPKDIIHPYVPTTFEKYGKYLSLLLPILTFVLCFKLWKKYGKDPVINPTIAPEFEIPEKLSPIDMGLVYTDGAFKNQFLSASIINLAVNKIISIKKIEKKGVFSSEDFELSKLKEDSKLSASESKLLSGLFGSKPKIKISSLKNKFYLEIPKVISAGTDYLAKKKWLVKASRIWQIIYLILGLIIIVFGFIGIVISPVFGISVILTGVIIFVFSFLMRSRTKEGAELLKRIKGLKMYMEKAEKYRQQFNEKENIFERFLPYAIMFGMTKLWISKMKQIYGEDYFNTYHPVWFIGPNFASFNVDQVASEISAMSSHMSSTISSSPSSSGSGGGGFSGGGGGGGGGGGW